jgi:hypothetical protein
MAVAPIAQTAANLGVALALGAAISFERQWRQRLAVQQPTATPAMVSAIPVCTSSSRGRTPRGLPRNTAMLQPATREVTGVSRHRIRVNHLEALNGTPIIDVKPVLDDEIGER